MTRPEAIGEEDLHAYADGALDGAAEARVEAWLGEHPADAARVRAWREQKRALHALFDPLLDEQPPARLQALLAGRSPARRPWRLVRLAAAAAALFALGVGAGWQLRGGPAAPPDLAGQALGAHLVYAGEVRHPVEVGADQEAHLVGWLSKRLGHPVKAPRLAEQGFRLVGGRLLPDAGTPAAQFMYEDKAGRRVTLYVRAGGTARETAFRFVAQGEVAAFYWIDGPLGYALTGALPRPDLLDLATRVHHQVAP